jgi:DNA modification methylase
MVPYYLICKEPFFMKKITEAQLRQIIRQELLNEIKFDLRGGSAMRTPEERKAEGLPAFQNIYDPSAPVVDTKFRSKPDNIIKKFTAKQFFDMLRDIRDDQLLNQYGREIAILKINYDTMPRQFRSMYDKDTVKAYIIDKNGKMFLKIPNPSETEEFEYIELQQNLFDKIMSA